MRPILDPPSLDLGRTLSSFSELHTWDSSERRQLLVFMVTDSGADSQLYFIRHRKRGSGARFVCGRGGDISLPCDVSYH